MMPAVPPGGRVVPVLAALLLTVCPLTALSQADDESGGAEPATGEEEIAGLYRDAARDLYRSANFSEAETIVDRGLEFAPEHSDLLALKGRIARRKLERTREAEGLFRRALEADAFAALDRASVVLDLAELLLRVGEAGQADELLSRRLGPPPYTDPRAYTVRAESYLALGDAAAAGRLVTAGLERFPDNVPLFALQVTLRDVADPLLVRRMRRLEEGSDAYRRLLLSYARSLENPALRRQEIERYFALGGEDPVASVLLLEITEDPLAELPRFERLGGLQDKGLIERLDAALPEGPARSRLRDSVRDTTGTLVRDPDRDGFSEGLYRFEAGSLTRWQQDADSDGLPEVVVALDDRVPRALRLRQGEDVALLRYGDYPEIARMTIFPAEGPPAEGPSMERPLAVDLDHVESYYEIRPAALELPILSPELNWGEAVPDAVLPIALAQALALYEEEQLRLAAYRRIYRGEEGGEVREWLEEGRTVRLEADRNGDGEMDHRLLYEAGERRAGLRDLDGDGAFELSEQYADGSLVFLALDEDADGIAEYTEEYGDADRFSWDLNDDGSVDVQELRRGRGEMQRLFTVDENETAGASTQ